MKSLDSIAIACETDRASVFTRTYGKPHDYARHYDHLFSPLRDKPVKLLEIGAGGGEGVRMWLEYFPSGQVMGIDIIHDTNPYNIQIVGLDKSKKSEIDPRYQFVPGDQTSVDFWVFFIAYFGAGFDIIIDDGLHSNIAVITTFNALWPHVNPGGFYAVEDLGVGYGGPSFFVRPEWPSQIDFLKGKIDEMNTNPSSDIDSIHLSKELAVFKKKGAA